MRASGLYSALVDIGEVAALGGPARLGVMDPKHGAFAQLAVTNQALGGMRQMLLLDLDGRMTALDL